MYDIVIIGGGILGVTAAEMLSKYDLDIAVIEKEYDLGERASKSNSAILDAGFNPRGGSLKGTASVRGNEMYHDICRRLDVPVNYLGTLLVAFGPDGHKKIRDKYQRGLENGAKGLRIIDGDEARRMEPLLSEEVTEALYAPSGAVIDVFKLVIRNAQLASINGVEFITDTEVKNINKTGAEADGTCAGSGAPDHFILETDRGDIAARFVINTAGGSAEIMDSCFRQRDLNVKPRRGQYLVFEKMDPCPLNHILYQANENNEGGCRVSPTVEGNILAGPTAENVRSFRNVNTTQEGMDLIRHVIDELVPAVNSEKIITSFAGVRANITSMDKEHKDFVVRRSTEGMVSALGIKNPGITCAPYLCQLMIETLQEDGLKLEEKQDYQWELHLQKNFFDCSRQEQERLLREDSDYSRVVCQCEKVTLGDIKRVLREPLPPVSINGFKKRLRLGMGQCQGGFCTPEVLEILSKEWNVPVNSICKSTPGSEMARGHVK